MLTFRKDVELFIEYLQIEKNSSKNTILNYENDINEFITFMKQQGINRFAAVSYACVRTYLTDLYQKKLSRRSVARKLSSLRSFYRFLLREGTVDMNVFSMASLPKKELSLPNFLYEEELNKLFSVSDVSTPLGIRNQAILELLYGTGIRVSECCGIRMSDLDFSIGTILIRGKGRKERYVPMGSYAIDALLLYIEKSRKVIMAKHHHSDHNFLFINYKGTTLSDRSVRKILNDMISKASMNVKVSPHTMRHTFATHLLNAGADLRSVQELLGHSHLSSTQVYTHVTKDHLRKVYMNHHPRA